jgi:acetyl-CoA carboxylase biotin carboxyl carrier protein
MDLKEIKTVIDLMTKNDLTEFELEKDQFKIRICKSGQSAPTYTVHAPAPALAPAASYAAPAPAATAAASAPAANLPAINSPMVGTFYMSPSPDSASYVSVGTEVNEETVVCIIEAMKVMNEIKAEIKGVITEIVAENGKPVEFGQPLFRIRPV